MDRKRKESLLMWSCPYCGNQMGMIFEDSQLTGIICLHPDCGRVDAIDQEKLKEYPQLFDDSDI